MVKNVRNFWITTSVDGRESIDGTGPVRKDGGFSVNVKVRDKGGISNREYNLNGTVDDDGTLYLELTAGGVQLWATIVGTR